MPPLADLTKATAKHPPKRKFSDPQLPPLPIKPFITGLQPTSSHLYRLTTSQTGPRTLTKSITVLPTEVLYSSAELAAEIDARAATHSVEICEEVRHARLIEELMAETELLKRKLSDAKGVNAELAGKLAWAGEQARLVLSENKHESKGKGDGEGLGRSGELLREISRWKIE